MAERVLGRSIELGDGLAELGKKEQRVVAEAGRAARRVEHLTVPAADRDQGLRIVGGAQRDQGADEACAPVVDVAQAIDQERVVGGVLDAPVVFAVVDRARHRRELRGRDARRAAERVDAQARVVGDRRATGRPRRMARLGERVLEERRVRLVGFADRELALGDELDPERREQRGELGELSRVVRREDQSHAGDVTPTRSAASRRAPSAARRRARRCLSTPARAARPSRCAKSSRVRPFPAARRSRRSRS